MKLGVVITSLFIDDLIIVIIIYYIYISMTNRIFIWYICIFIGLIDLSTLNEVDACAHKPESNYMLGDLTLEPTIAPSIYYWIPPLPTPGPPTMAPTSPPTFFEIYHDYIVGAVGGAILIDIIIVVYIYTSRRMARNRAGYIELSQQSNV